MKVFLVFVFVLFCLLLFFFIFFYFFFWQQPCFHTGHNKGGEGVRRIFLSFRHRLGSSIAGCCLVAQLCFFFLPTRLLCPWVSQARILEWVAFSFSDNYLFKTLSQSSTKTYKTIMIIIITLQNRASQKSLDP